MNRQKMKATIFFCAIPTFFPAVFFHCLNNHDEEKGEQVKSFPDVTAADLEQVLLVEGLEHAPLNLDELKNKKKFSFNSTSLLLLGRYCLGQR